MMLSFSELESASAALSRGLPAPVDWAFLIKKARQMAIQPLPLEKDDGDGVAVTPFSAPHFAAARILEDAAQFAPQSHPAQSREFGLWAAAAFAQNGNFPSSTVVARRTFPRRRRQDAATAALLCAVAPTLARALRADSPLAVHLSDFLASGEKKHARLTLDAWQEAARQSAGGVEPALWELAERGLRAALSLGTRHVLNDVGATFPAGFVEKVSGRVPALLPPQAQILRDGFLSGGNALAALAPGSGKTLLGEFFLSAALGADKTDGARWAVFMVPYVALGRGVMAAVRSHFPDTVQLHQWLGGASHSDEDTDLSQGTHIVVTTPERLDAYLRRQPQAWATLRALVCDEAHLIGDGARGVRMEGLLTRLKLEQKSGDARLLLLSAALDDAEKLARWVDARHQVASQWTPTARRLAFWRSDGRLEWHGDMAGKGLQPLGTTRLAPLRSPLPATGHWPKMQQLEPLARQNVAHFTHQIYETRGGPILCLCATRRATRELAQYLGEKWEAASEVGGHRARAIAAIEARHRNFLPLVDLLKRGVAWHNSSLPQEVRAAIEMGVAEGEIHVVAATSTLAEGVDLPFRFTILSDWLKWGDAGQEPISPALFRNIAGRCGRAGAFTEGDTLIFDNPLGDERFTAPERRIALQNSLYLGNELGPTRSALARFDTERGQVRSTIEAAFETQLLAALGESGGETTPTFIARFVGATYLGMGDSHVGEWQGFAQTCVENWHNEGLLDVSEKGVSLSKRGMAWRATDLSPATCGRLMGALHNLPDGDFSGATGLARLNGYLWRAVGAAPEAGAEIARFFAPRSRLVARPADMENLGARWLRGESLEAVFAALPRVVRSNHAGLREWVEGSVETQSVEASPPWAAAYEKWLDFVRVGLETWSPWLWRAAALLAPLAGNAARVDWRRGALLWEEGVDTQWAARASRAQAPATRATLARLGGVWPFPIENVTHDPLALAKLQTADGQHSVESVFQTVLREAGGRHCVAGRDVLALRDWIWAKAGLSK